MSLANRQFSRFTVRLPASLSYQEELIDVVVTNLSVGGAFLETERQLMLESELQLSVQLPEPAHHLDVRARVIWKHPQGLGLSFERLKPLDVWSLLKLESALAAGKLSFDEEVRPPNAADGAIFSEKETPEAEADESPAEAEAEDVLSGEVVEPQGEQSDIESSTEGIEDEAEGSKEQ